MGVASFLLMDVWSVSSFLLVLIVAEEVLVSCMPVWMFRKGRLGNVEFWEVIYLCVIHSANSSEHVRCAPSPECLLPSRSSQCRPGAAM